MLEALARLEARPEVELDLEPVLAAVAGVDLGPVLERVGGGQAATLREIGEVSAALGALTEAVADAGGAAKAGLDVATRIDGRPPTDLQPVLDAVAKLKRPPKVDFKPLLDALEAHFAEQAKALAKLTEDSAKSKSLLWATPSGVW